MIVALLMGYNSLKFLILYVLAWFFLLKYYWTYYYLNKQIFLTMNIVKTRLRNKMEDDFLTDSLILYIEREIVATFNIDLIINDFDNVKIRRLLFS